MRVKGKEMGTDDLPGAEGGGVFRRFFTPPLVVHAHSDQRDSDLR